jgi:chemotaxis-related protein WspB
MLLLLFQLDEDRYALDARQVAEVLPLVTITPIPQAPTGVAGLFNYRGTPVPAIDLSQLAIGRPAHSRLNTRIVVVHYPDAHGNTHLLGLVAEKATETVRREPEDFLASGVTNHRAPYLGSVARDARGLMHWVDLQTLLPESVRGVLFRKSPDH